MVSIVSGMPAATFTVWRSQQAGLAPLGGLRGEGVGEAPGLAALPGARVVGGGGRTNEEILNHSAEGPGTRPSRETATCRLPLMGPKASAIMESFCSCGKSPGMQNYKSPICAGRREGCLSGRLTRKDLLVR